MSSLSGGLGWSPSSKLILASFSGIFKHSEARKMGNLPRTLDGIVCSNQNHLIS